MADETPHGRHRRPTLADVAALAGVSVPLVSIVMRDAPGASAASRQRVMQAAEELGYRPDSRARLLRSGHSRLIGVTFGVQEAFHGDLLTGLYTAADAVGYELALSAVTPNRDERRAVSGLLHDRCEAVVMLGPQIPAKEIVQVAGRLPVVVVARQINDRTIDTVRTADNLGLEQAIDHLVGLGHRRIAHIDGGTAPGAAERRRGYQNAMRRHRLQDEIRLFTGGLTEDAGAVAARAMLTEASPAPTAVAVFNDRCALGVIDAARREGLSVPSDLSVVGFDDSRLARVAYIELTTVAQDTTQLAALAVGRAVDRIDNTSVGRRDVVVPPHLVIRGTTAALRRPDGD